MAEDPRSPVALAASLARAGKCHVLCLGDAMLDIEVSCHSGRLSPEAPVLVFAEGRHSSRPGGAANVALGAAALGAQVSLLSPLGADSEGAELAGHLAAAGIGPDLMALACAGRDTTRKTRFIADGQQLLRIDRETNQPLSEDEADALFAGIAAQSGPPDAILLSDYGKGALTKRLIEHCRALRGSLPVPMLVDPKGNDWARYGEVDLIKPNAIELEAFTGISCRELAGTERALAQALERCGANAILVTRGGLGASLLERGTDEVVHFPAEAVEVADVCGAGDTNLAALGVMLALGASLFEAIACAQLASAVAVQRHGTAVIGAADVLALAGQRHSGRRGVVVDEAGLDMLLASWRSEGLRIGFSNGCFDVVHAGHVRSLAEAAALCDRLVVGLNSDASVRALKGPGRPVNPADDRAAVIAGLGSVAAVSLFDEETPARLIERVRPDVLVKGGDYDPGTMVGADFVRSYGGEVRVTALLPGRSTSRILALAGARE